MRHGMVVIDAAGSPSHGTPTLDARAEVIALQLSNDRGEEIYRRTGRWPNPILSGVRLLWLAEHAPRHWRVHRLPWALPIGWDTGYPEPSPPAGPLQANQWPTPSSSRRGTTT